MHRAPCALQVQHVNGGLYRVVSTPSFHDLPPRTTLQVDFEAELWMTSRSDVLPNWYVVERGCPLALVLSSTAGYQRSFVRPFITPVQWKTSASDTYSPLSPEDRYVTAIVNNLPVNSYDRKTKYSAQSKSLDADVSLSFWSSSRNV